MKSKQLMDALAAVQLVSNTIPDINAGGCGAFALVMAKALEAAGVEYKIWGSRDEWVHDTTDVANREYRKGNVKSCSDWDFWSGGMLRQHLFLTIKVGHKWWVYDGYELVPDDGEYVPIDLQRTIVRTKEPILLGALEAMVNNHGGNSWNDSYDPANTPLIQEAAESAFGLAA